ncbi:sporulation protein [Streptomyces ambofaciens]
MDSLTATPLPAQESVMKAFGQRGFGFESADLANGQVDGTSRSLRF